MKRLAELPFLVLLLGVVALATWVPAAHAAILGDHHTAQAFFYSGLLLQVLTVMLAIATWQLRARNPAYGQLAGLAGAFLVLPVAMALPLGLTLRDTTWVNAWFEMLSSFTTTGATVYDPGRLPPSVHLWRALAGWFGGFFVLLSAYAILAPMNLGGVEVISGRVPGHSLLGAGQVARGGETPAARLLRHAGIILPVYAALTLGLWLMLLIAGENGLVALTHAMGTLSTSGISAGHGLADADAGLAGEVLMFFFMLLALSRHLIPLPGLNPRHSQLHDDPELRLGLMLILLVIVVLLARHLVSDKVSDGIETLPQFIRAFWGAAFSAASFLTTTGYESLWWSSARDWAGFGGPGLLLLGLAIIGGGVSTTAGGVTLLRVYALLLHGRRELERIIHPSAVVGGGAGMRRLAREGAHLAWVFFMLFAITLAVVMALLTVAGLAFTEALILAVSALTTTGPLAAVAGQVPISYAVQSDPVKAILGITMVLGRIETVALIALIAPGSWRR